MSSFVLLDITDNVTIIEDGIAGDQTTAIFEIYIGAHHSCVIMFITMYLATFSSFNTLIRRCVKS